MLHKGVCLTILLLAAACGGDDPGAPRPLSRGLRIISGADVTDSARARLTTPLIVEVHDSSGALVPPGTLVRFEVLQDTGGAGVAPLTSNAYSSVATGMTDGTGRTGALVWLGRYAGPLRLAISAPTQGVADTVQYIVTPASLAGIDAFPRDTALYIGRTYTLQARARDQYGNARPDAITWSIERQGAAVNGAGVVSATVVGRYQVRVSAAAVSDTTRFSALPPGILAAFDVNENEVVTIELDGSNRRVRTTAMNGGIGVRPRWLAGSDDIVYSTYNGVIQELRVVNSAGASVPFLPSPPSTMSHQADAAPSPDGSTVFFAAHDSRCSNEEYCLFRSSPDGSAIELLGNDANPSAISFRPSSSPDARQVAFTTIENGAAVVKVLDLTSRTVLPWTISGAFPQWSPAGGRIAFRDETGAVSLINSDGTGVQELITGPGYYSAGSMGWSPDGLYIVANSFTGFQLVIVASGESLPLPYLNALGDASWK